MSVSLFAYSPHLCYNNRMKRILSINLWYEKYGNKTRAQLKSFRKLGYATFVATIADGLTVYVYELSDGVASSCKDSTVATVEQANSNCNTVFSKQCTSYDEAFKTIFEYACEQKFDVIYIRRLMSKLLKASKYIKKASKQIPIAYEIPTYPLDTGGSFLYATRDFIEMSAYKLVNPYIKKTLVNLIAEMNLPANWEVFHNGIDIDDYAQSSYPELDNTIKFLMVANISEYHHYERMLTAMKEYANENGEQNKIHLTVISPDSPAYDGLKSQAKDLGIEQMIDFKQSMTMAEIQKIAKDCHIGVGQLSRSDKGSNLVNTLKSKDYCAMGIPFFSTCYDTSFEKDFEYIYVTEDMDSDIRLDDIISWYINIRNDVKYRSKMYNYAKNNLQFDKLAKQVDELT